MKHKIKIASMNKRFIHWSWFADNGYLSWLTLWRAEALISIASLCRTASIHWSMTWSCCFSSSRIGRPIELSNWHNNLTYHAHLLVCGLVIGNKWSTTWRTKCKLSVHTDPIPLTYNGAANQITLAAFRDSSSDDWTSTALHYSLYFLTCKWYHTSCFPRFIIRWLIKHSPTSQSVLLNMQMTPH